MFGGHSAGSLLHRRQSGSSSSAPGTGSSFSCLRTPPSRTNSTDGSIGRWQQMLSGPSLGTRRCRSDLLFPSDGDGGGDTANRKPRASRSLTHVSNSSPKSQEAEAVLYGLCT